MSSGPGILQRKILDTLRKYDSFVAQRKILWEIAEDTNKIEVTGELSNGELRSGIRTGSITKPFRENFRRAVKRLDEEGLIETMESRFTDLGEALSYFPYHTSDLEIFHLRKELLPTIMEYAREGNVERRISSSEIEDRQILELMDPEKHEEAGRKWDKIQKGILSILDRNDTDNFEDWLQCLVRGRYLFKDGKISYSKSFIQIRSALKKQKNITPAEKDVLKSIRQLESSAFDIKDWKIGKLKSILYGLGQFQMFQKETLNDSVKKDLLKKHEVLITALPGHEEPKRIPVMGTKWAHIGEEKYSKYLDKLLTRQILKEQKFIRIPMTS